MTGELENLGLCYVDTPWAWFTSLPVEDQWGDDWDDAPYQNNAGRPCPEDGVTLRKVAFDGRVRAPASPLRDDVGGRAPHDPGRGVAVEDMNRGDDRVPWLVEQDYGAGDTGSPVEIAAGTSLPEFVELVESAGGSVYRDESTNGGDN